MLRKLIILGLVLMVAGLGVFWLLTMPARVSADALGPHTPDVANGKSMFFAGGCASCHAVPGQEDSTRLGGGLGLKSPFGTFYVPNVSSDRTDGIGDWNEAEFVTAMVKGTSRSGEHYYPAFPYTSYQKMRVADLRDLFAYLKTLPAVPGKVRGHDLPFPFSIRRGLGLWKLLNLDGQPFRPDPGRSAEWNRGAYLVNGPGHCAECHSPRDFLGGIVSRHRFTGGPHPEGEGWIPNITSARLNDWSEGDLVEFLSTGLMPSGDTVGSSMVAVVRNIGQLPEADRKAIAVYIKSLPPVEGAKPPAKKE
jgi:mono/diheme cytochrome c family protein